MQSRGLEAGGGARAQRAGRAADAGGCGRGGMRGVALPDELISPGSRNAPLLAAA